MLNDAALPTRWQAAATPSRGAVSDSTARRGSSQEHSQQLSLQQQQQSQQEPSQQQQQSQQQRGQPAPLDATPPAASPARSCGSISSGGMLGRTGLSQLRLYAHRRQHAQQVQQTQHAEQQLSQAATWQPEERAAQARGGQMPSPAAPAALSSLGICDTSNPLKRRLDGALQAAAAGPHDCCNDGEHAETEPPRQRPRTHAPAAGVGDQHADPADVPTQLLTQQAQQPAAARGSQAHNAAATGVAAEPAPAGAAAAAPPAGARAGGPGSSLPTCASSEVVDLTLSDDDGEPEGAPATANGGPGAPGAERAAAAAALLPAEPAFLSCPYGGDSLAAQLSKVRADVRALEEALQQVRRLPAAAALGGWRRLPRGTGASRVCSHAHVLFNMCLSCPESSLCARTLWLQAAPQSRCGKRAVRTRGRARRRGRPPCPLAAAHHAGAGRGGAAAARALSLLRHARLHPPPRF